MAKSQNVNDVIVETTDDDDEDTANILKGLDPLFGEPVGTTVQASPTSAGGKPVFPILGLTQEQEKTAATAGGALLGPGVQRLLQRTVPEGGARTTAAMEKLREELSLARLMRSLEEEELLRRGIRPSDLTAAQTPPATSGTKWMRNWAGVDREIPGGVPEASAAYQRSKGQGKVTSKITKKFGPEALQPGGLSIRNPAREAAEAARLDRVMQASALTPEEAARAAAQARFEAARPGALSNVGRAVRSPLVQGPLAGGFAGLSFYDAYRKWMEGDRSGAVIDALGGIGGLLTMIPTPLTMGAGLALGLGSLPASYINERLKAQPEQEPSTTSP